MLKSNVFTLYKNIKMKTFEIGEKVTWQVGNIISSGAVLEDLGDKLNVITHYIGGKRAILEITIFKNVLI